MSAHVIPGPVALVGLWCAGVRFRRLAEGRYRVLVPRWLWGSRAKLLTALAARYRARADVRVKMHEEGGGFTVLAPGTMIEVVRRGRP